MAIDYPSAVALVSSLQNKGWRLELDRMHEFLLRGGLGQKLGQTGGPEFVHVAGTNGKGSVTAFVQSILMEQGHKVGATFSPYVYDVRERIQFGKKTDQSTLISRQDFAAAVEQLWPIGLELEDSEFGGPTEFEFKTAMGFLHWANKQADYVALEVGLGGRLDATNVVDPACSVIVSIGLDHTAILGNTLAEIAIEKAGIIKPNKPVVVGDVPEEAYLAIETIAKVNEAPIWKFGREIILSASFEGFRVTTPGGTYERLSPGIPGAIQPHNLALAIAASELAGGVSEARRVAHGVAKANIPGRMQTVTYKGQKFLLDGAHNQEAVAELVKNLPPGAQIVLLTGMLEGHSAGDFYEPLSKLISQVHFAPIDFHRARSPVDLDRESGFLFERSFCHASIADAITGAMESFPDLVLVTGSFYLVGGVGRELGLTRD